MIPKGLNKERDKKNETISKKIFILCTNIYLS